MVDTAQRSGATPSTRASHLPEKLSIGSKRLFGDPRGRPSLRLTFDPLDHQRHAIVLRFESAAEPVTLAPPVHRHPEARTKRASKGAGPGPASFEGRFRGHLRMTGHTRAGAANKRFKLPENF